MLSRQPTATRGGCAAEFYLQIFDIALSAQMRRRCFPMGKQPGRYYLPLRTLRNIRSVIRWHRLRRGGYYPPANVANFWAEPYWPGNVTMFPNAPCFDIVPPNFIAKCSYCIVGALRRRCFPNRKTTGRMISAPTNAPKFSLGDSVAPTHRHIFAPTPIEITPAGSIAPKFTAYPYKKRVRRCWRTRKNG